MLVLLCLYGASAVEAQRRPNQNPSAIPNVRPNVQTVLQRINIPNPLRLAAEALGLDFALDFLGGQQGMENWNRNWNETILPGMQDMTAQWHTAVLDRTRNFGAGLDAQNAAEDQLQRELAELEAMENVSVSETACAVAGGVAGSGGGGAGGLAEAGHVANAITRALGEELTGAALNRKGSPSEFGAVADTADRYNMYAKHFCDPEMNNGQAGCDPEGPQLHNADISIENFLLKDTIDMSRKEEELAAYAILRNLVQPSASNPIPVSAMSDFSGQSTMIARRELQGLRNMPVAVVGGIIGRRTALPGSNTAETIRPIRLAAGVPPEEISNKSSFNETMLALTKERFYDPAYFEKISRAGDAEILQEQTAVDVLTSIMLRQIYVMQEQMNGLMAARASIKHNERYGNMMQSIGSVSDSPAPAATP